MVEGPDVEEIFAEFWAPIVCPDGVWDHDAVKAELHDYAVLLESVPKVYCHITHNRISKPNTIAAAVIAEHDDVCRNGLDDDTLERIILRLVGDYSEETRAAGWYHGIERSLWVDYHADPVDPDVILIGELCEILGRWPIWRIHDDAPTTIPIAEFDA